MAWPNIQRQIVVLHNSEPGHDKLYIVRIDDVAGTLPTYDVTASWGKRTASTLQNMSKGRFGSLQMAQQKAGELLSEKISKGYGVVGAAIGISKIDTSRVVDTSTPVRTVRDDPPRSTPSPTRTSTPTPRAARTDASYPASGRVERDVDF